MEPDSPCLTSALKNSRTPGLDDSASLLFQPDEAVTPRTVN